MFHLHYKYFKLKIKESSTKAISKLMFIMIIVIIAVITNRNEAIKSNFLKSINDSSTYNYFSVIMKVKEKEKIKCS